MKTVVITGSARGLGLEMAKVFRQNNLNIVISDLNEDKLLLAKEQLESIKSTSKVSTYICNVTNTNDIINLIDFTKKEYGNIDIWINNAGVNQPDKPIWELTEKEINLVLDVDLKGTIIGSKLAMQAMLEQHNGAIYNIEGYGSNDAKMLGLSIYGTSKRAVTYFTEALAKESAEKNTGIIVGRLSPGIMITDFITNALGDKEKINLPEKTKKVYNILGDYPDVVAKFLVNGILNNTKNNAHIEWLTTKKAAWRFMTSGFNKRDFFSQSNNK
jgi:NAD(P)-dependent dehydrogenase (short-subunit alcohol dehydrogenase family)